LKNLNIGQRMGLGFSVIVLLLAVAVGATIWQVAGIKSGTDRIVDLRTPTAQASASLSSDIYASCVIAWLDVDRQSGF